MSTHRIELRDGCAIFHLANGNNISIAFEDKLSVEGYKLIVLADHVLTIAPRSGNACELSTPRATIELERLVTAVVVNRKKREG